VTGIAALLLSLQLRDGKPPDPLAIGRVLLETARPCMLEETLGEPRRCLGGKLDVAAAMGRVLDGGRRGAPRVDVVRARRASGAATATAGVVPSEPAVEPAALASPTPLVYAVGSLHYDFGTEARRDSFVQLMAADAVDAALPPNPNSAQQMVSYLTRHPSEAEALIWTLNIELTPIYAIGPVGPRSPRVFELLVGLLAAELAGVDDAWRIERVGIPGRLTGHTVELSSHQVVPVVDVEDVRGIYGWPVGTLAQAARTRVDREGGDPDVTAQALRELLTRVYYELRNFGLTASDRALNFAMTGAFAAVDTLAAAVATGMALETVVVKRSELCRPDSDCWDVTLRFFNPDDLRSGRRVSRFAVDVSDVVPVTLGMVRTWSESPAHSEQS
jgi:cyanobactin maturation PatA/PatG family protease